MLTRNASGNSLAASTDPSAIAGLAEALIDATPRSCLAIRRAGIHERKLAAAPLQTCELCHRVEGGSVCIPSVVGGEVIGSLLVLADRTIKPVERERVVVAVSQAAPILANLRTLAIAEHRAATDPLTRLPNSRSVQEVLIRMVAQSSRTGDPLSAIVLDLDHFKALNDRHGHQAGDEVLECVGAALRHGVRASDFAGRWGGEEFVVLLPATEREGALARRRVAARGSRAAQGPRRDRERHREPWRRHLPRARGGRHRADPHGRPRALPRQGRGRNRVAAAVPGEEPVR